MKKLYLVGTVIVFLLIMIISLPQLGGSCQFYGTLQKTTNCTFALTQTAGLGGIMGGLMVLYWKEPLEKDYEEGDDDMAADDDGDSGKSDTKID